MVSVDTMVSIDTIVEWRHGRALDVIGRLCATQAQLLAEQD